MESAIEWLTRGNAEHEKAGKDPAFYCIESCCRLGDQRCGAHIRSKKNQAGYNNGQNDLASGGFASLLNAFIDNFLRGGAKESSQGGQSRGQFAFLFSLSHKCSSFVVGVACQKLHNNS